MGKYQQIDVMVKTKVHEYIASDSRTFMTNPLIPRFPPLLLTWPVAGSSTPGL